MADEEQPAWLRDSGSAAKPTATSNGSSAPAPSPSGDKEPPFKAVVKSLILVMNVGSSIFMAATGALGIGATNSINDTGPLFVGIYMMLFASILFIFESAQFCSGSSIDGIMKRNFGFLYGHIGKGLYILFMGILAFGLKSPKTLATACGVVVSAWGVALVLLYFWIPGYFDKKEKYQP